MINLGEKISLGKYFYKSDTPWKRKILMVQDQVKTQTKVSVRNKVSVMTSPIWDVLGTLTRAVHEMIKEEYE